MYRWANDFFLYFFTNLTLILLGFLIHNTRTQFLQFECNYECSATGSDPIINILLHGVSLKLIGFHSCFTRYIQTNSWVYLHDHLLLVWVLISVKNSIIFDISLIIINSTINLQQMRCLIQRDNSFHEIAAFLRINYLTTCEHDWFGWVIAAN